jgi:diadenosine tetraphosphate (Ap4A) HIT family hydrolase
LQNNGQLAHQAVNHVHFHLIPKPNEEEGLGVVWNQLKFTDDQFKALVQEITQSISK